MNDNLTVFGVDYTNVTGIKVKGTGNSTLTYIRPTGTKSISANGTGINVAQYASVDVAVPTTNDFIVTLSYNESTEMWEPNKTYAEIQAAYEAGKAIAVEATPNENGDTPAVTGEWMLMAGETFAYVVDDIHISSVSGNLDGTIQKNYFLTTTGLVNPVNQRLWITEDATATPSDVLSGKVFYNADGQQTGTATTPTPTLQSKTATPTEQQQTVSPDSGYDGLSSVTVEAISTDYVGSDIARRSSTDLTASWDTVTVPAGYYSETGSKAIQHAELSSPDASYNSNRPDKISADFYVTKVGFVDGSDSASSEKTLSSILPTQATVTVTPSETEQTAVAQYKWTTGEVKVGAISSTYVGSGITRRSSSDLTASSATVTVPAGYYAEQASKAVASGSAGTPTATKGTVSNHSITVTPSVTNTTGYITGGTKNGTAVTVSASELVSGTYTVNSTGTKDVTNYASISVPSGSATAPSSITGTTATMSTGTNTLTLTKSVSVTPSVTAGYISSGTVGNSSVSLTANVTTKVAATITPSTTDQTIAAGTYLTGTQTIAGDADLVASNIVSGVQIFGVTGNVVLQNYYTGSSAPSSSLGQNGDIYIQQ